MVLHMVLLYMQSIYMSLVIKSKVETLIHIIFRYINLIEAKEGELRAYGS